MGGRREDGSSKSKMLKFGRKELVITFAGRERGEILLENLDEHRWYIKVQLQGV